AFTRILNGATSTASPRVSVTTAPLVALWAVTPGRGATAPIEAVFTITPPPRSFITGTANLQPRYTPRTLVAKTRSYSSSGSSQSGVIRCEKPALLTRMSSPPKPDTASSIIAFTSAERETSARKKRAAPPSLAIAEATRRPFSSFTSATTTRAPSRAKRVAIASPNPDPAPVTTAILPSNLMAALYRNSTCGRQTQQSSHLGPGVHGRPDPPVRRDHLARDRPRRVRGEEHDHVGHLLGRREPPGRDHVEDRLGD